MEDKKYKSTFVWHDADGNRYITDVAPTIKMRQRIRGRPKKGFEKPKDAVKESTRRIPHASDWL